MPEPTTVGVQASREGGVGRIILDRPHAINALNLTMVRRIAEVLQAWRSEALPAITIESSTAGMFCAGGDIRQIRQNTIDSDLGSSDEFFATEYGVNRMLASYPIPVVALIDGICMGGGLGLSVHGHFRVVTERAILAMPETAIGFFPDVGASHFLARLPGSLGAYLGLTGARLGPSDAVDIGLATHHISSDRLPALPGLLTDTGRPVDAILRDLASPPEDDGALRSNRHRIDAVFGSSSIDTILRRLMEDGSQWALDAIRTLDRMSPQSLALTLDLILWGRQRSLEECLDAERAAAHHAVRSADFLEGVRAALVDKDRAPKWTTSQYVGMSSRGQIRWAEDRLGLPQRRHP